MEIESVRIELEIRYASGGMTGKTFSSVRQLADYLRQHPDIAERVEYVPKKKEKPVAPPHPVLLEKPRYKKPTASQVNGNQKPAGSQYNTSKKAKMQFINEVNGRIARGEMEPWPKGWEDRL